MAENFGRAARAASVRRIVYLGGLGEEGADLSPHLRSRHEVGRVLRASGVPVIEFRASIVIGSGSLSFEMLRALVERLPVMVMPRWVRAVSQPIAIGDLLAYLEAALDLETGESRIYEIGGAERVSYGDLMREYARQRGLRRLTIPVPVLTPRLSSLWLGLVTPLYARVGRQLIDSIRHETVVRNDAARRAFSVVPSDTRSAIARALANEDNDLAETRWPDPLSAIGARPARAPRSGPGRLLVDDAAGRAGSFEGTPPRHFFAPSSLPQDVGCAASRTIKAHTGCCACAGVADLAAERPLHHPAAGGMAEKRAPSYRKVVDSLANPIYK